MPDDDALYGELRRWVADAHAEDAAHDRARLRVLRQIGEEEATFAGIILDLAERGGPVTIRTAAGRVHRGRVVALGRDFVVVREGELPPVFVALSAAVAVRPVPSDRSAAIAGARRPPLEASLAAVLAGLAGERPRIHLAVAGDAQVIAGELRAVGSDVAVLRSDDGSTLYVHLDTVLEVVLHDLAV
ncbi:MAG TPA: hypothetical protein VHN98_12625 [Acidimicrobiales bacterium]|nr:hypothetical protein [Acidimicrobiales bacterium]